MICKINLYDVNYTWLLLASHSINRDDDSTHIAVNIWHRCIRIERHIQPQFLNYCSYLITGYYVKFLNPMTMVARKKIPRRGRPRGLPNMIELP